MAQVNGQQPDTNSSSRDTPNAIAQPNKQQLDIKYNTSGSLDAFCSYNRLKEELDIDNAQLRKLQDNAETLLEQRDMIKGQCDPFVIQRHLLEPLIKSVDGLRAKYEAHANMAWLNKALVCMVHKVKSRERHKIIMRHGPGVLAKYSEQALNDPLVPAQHSVFQYKRKRPTVQPVAKTSILDAQDEDDQPLLQRLIKRRAIDDLATSAAMSQPTPLTQQQSMTEAQAEMTSPEHRETIDLTLLDSSPPDAKPQIPASQIAPTDSEGRKPWVPTPQHQAFPGPRVFGSFANQAIDGMPQFGNESRYPTTTTGGAAATTPQPITEDEEDLEIEEMELAIMKRELAIKKAKKALRSG